MRTLRLLLAIVSGLALPACVEVGPLSEETAALNATISNDHQYNDTTGTAGTYSSSGSVSTTSPFFQDLGTNGRTCFSCHQFDQGWTITPASVQTRFDSSAGSDPIFASVDGTNSPVADVSTLAAKTSATTMLRTKGLIRIGLPIPAGAEFTLSAVDDPYHFASAAQLSLFRRPLPTTNVRFLTTVMWDGRENVAGQTIDADLLHQANSAMLSHAQAATSLTATQERAIVDFMEGMYTAQIKDQDSKDVASMGSVGGPDYLATVSFYIGINDLFGDSQTKAAFSSKVFSLYDQWATTQTGTGDKEKARLSMLRGQTVFNTKPIRITGVAGINDSPAFGSPAVVNGTCTTCHDTPNVGNHSVALPINIGLADGSRRTPDLPLYTLRNTATGATVQVTDPGRALVTGKWADIGKFKGPILRGLAARAPYFHNGFAATLTDVVNFYQTRFGVGLTTQETTDLLMFLRSL